MPLTTPPFAARSPGARGRGAARWITVLGGLTLAHSILSCGRDPLDDPPGSPLPDPSQGSIREPTPAPARDPDAARAAREQATAARLRGDRPETIAALERAHAADPQDAEIGLELAETLLAPGAGASPARALEVLDRVWTTPPPHFAGQLALARATFRTHHYERCQTLVQRWFERGTMPPAVALEAHFLLGSIAERGADFESAVQHFDAALAIAPDSALHLTRRAHCLDELGRADEARRDARRAVQVDPGAAEAWWILAQLCTRSGATEEAEQARRIHSLLNRLTDSRSQTEESHRQRHAALEELAQVHPRYLEGRRRLAEYQLRFGEPEAACETARAAALEAPGRRELWATLLACLRQHLGDEATRAEVPGLLAAAPDLPEDLRRELLQVMNEGFRE